MAGAKKRGSAVKFTIIQEQAFVLLYYANERVFGGRFDWNH